MKKNLLPFVLPCLLSMLIFSACKKTKTVTEEHYLKLSDSSVAFQAAGNPSATVRVFAQPNTWQVSCEATWLEIQNIKANSFDIVTEDNDTGDYRSAEITVTVGKEFKETVTVSQVANNIPFHRYYNMTFYQGGVVFSANGKYAGAFRWEYPEDGGEIEYIPFIIDLENDVWHELGHYPGSLVKFMQPMAIPDDGQYVILASQNAGNAKVDMDGTFTMLKAPEGYTKNPEIASISADGTWVGWSGKDGVSSPFKWVDGVAIALPKPEKNFRDEPIGDVQARGISANGKIIYGTTWDNEDYGMIYWDENNEVRYVGEDVHKIIPVERPGIDGTPRKYNLANGMWTTDTRNNVSPNGKWIAGTYRTEELSDNGDEVYWTQYPAFYNTETKTTTIIEELRDGGGITVTNDGIGFAVNSAVKNLPPTFGYVVDLETKTVLGTCVDWIKENYGIHVPTGYIQYIPEGGKSVLGAMLFTGGASPEGVNWMILPER